MFLDLPLEELRDYRPDVEEPADFDDFWRGQVDAARDLAARDGGRPVFTAVDSPLTHAEVVDVSFPGYGGDTVKGWLLLPHRGRPDAALVVEFVGYNGGRGQPLDWLAWSSAGHPHLVMDSRGQGGGWRSSDTSDAHDDGAPSTNGFMTRGVADPASYYFTRLYVDAVRAVDAALAHPAAAGRPVVSTGASQGGALALAAAHLHHEVAASLPDVPFLAHPRRAARVTDARPFGELVEYGAVHPERMDRVFTTLSYVDVVNHAKRITVPGLFSVGLVDPITPPSTVFAAFNHYAGPKDIGVYPFNGHEGGGTTHLLRKIETVRGLT
jgi:cephalosporin-C deacetylase